MCIPVLIFRFVFDMEYLSNPETTKVVLVEKWMEELKEKDNRTLQIIGQRRAWASGYIPLMIL